MITKPLVSIIIPCFNAERWIRATVESALTQTWPTVEVIVVDDGSSDGSVELLKEFGTQIIYVSTPNYGPSAARNRGLDLAKGEWIQFLDSDDLMHPQKVEIALQACVTHSEVEFVWAPYNVVGESFSLINVPSYDQCTVRATLSRDALHAHHATWAALFRRRFLQRTGKWNESLKGWEDFEYHARIAVQRPLWMRLSEPLHFYRQHGGERVHRPTRTRESLRREIDCLLNTRIALEKSDLPLSSWSWALWPSYIDVARSAVQVGDKNSFVSFIRTAAELREDRRFVFKSRLAQLLATIFGLKLTSALLERVLPPRQ